MSCPECSKSYLMRCPACGISLLRVVLEGLWCPECGYLKPSKVSEQTLAMTEVIKTGSEKRK